MKNKSTKDLLYEYIVNKYQINTPILITDIYEFFSNINRNTIRSVVNRLLNENSITKIKNGVYALPNTDSVLNMPSVYISDIIQMKYIGNNDCVFGYKTGINFANELGLTTQTANVESIISNNVSKKKREITLNKNAINCQRSTN